MNGFRLRTACARIAALTSAAVACVTGCQFPAGGSRSVEDKSSGPAEIARLRAAYPDLQHGDVAVLSACQTPADVALFRLVPRFAAVEDSPRPALSDQVSRARTGGRSLRFTLNDPEDALWFDLPRDDGGTIPRDWRPYAVLVFSVHAPPTGVLLEFAVHAGVDGAQRWSASRYIKPGWNLLRFDLDAIADEIDLSTVRELSWRGLGIVEPAELHLDDLALADNTHHLLPASDAPDEMNVYSRGRRVYVGVAGRFEVGFSDGLLTAWRDPSRRVNLTVSTGLGPWPLALPADWPLPDAPPRLYDDPEMFAAWGEHVSARQRIVESSRFRVVVEGLWRFFQRPTSMTDQAAATRPMHTWRYVVYPWGAVYVLQTSSAADAGWHDSQVGWAIALAGDQGLAPATRSTPTSDDSPTRFVLMTRGGKDACDLLWAPHDPNAAATALMLESADRRRLVATLGAVEARPTVRSAHLLRFWPLNLHASNEAERIVRDYKRPVRITPTGGRLKLDAPGDLNHDGYNESEGCYETELVRGRLRFTYDPGTHGRDHPTFRVHATDKLRCRIYVNGRILKTTGRDAAGNLMFVIPRTVRRPLAIEVHAGPR